jgi:hypothetical protein
VTFFLRDHDNHIPNYLKMGCTGTLLDGTLLGAWPSNLLTSVGVPSQVFSPAADIFSGTEMLTPVDQPLDKLEDLRPDEMCVICCFEQVTVILNIIILQR